jgi:predicted permease
VIGAFWSDVRLGLRRLGHSVGFTAIAVFSLALGAGPNVAIFALTNAMLLRPVPGVSDPGRLVWVLGRAGDGASFVSASYPDYLDYAERTQTLEGMIAFDNVTLKLRQGDRVDVVHAQAVSNNFFASLGVKPALGRTVASMGASGAAEGPTIVLGHGFWTRWLGSDPDVIGAHLTVNGVPCTVAGVAGRAFAGTEAGMPPDLWFPAELLSRLTPTAGGSDPLSQRDLRRFQVWARLRNTATLEQAQAEMATIGSGIERDHPVSNKDLTASVAPVRGGVNPLEHGDMLGMAMLLMGLMSLVLLIACVNVASLISIRAARRHKDLALQLALGASRGRLVRELVVESLLLFLMGGVLAVGFALWTARALMAFAPTDRPLLVESLLDLRLFVFALAVSGVCGLVFGFLAVLGVFKADIVSSLKADNSGAALKAGRPRLSGVFVVAQVALSVVLLVSAGLFVRTLQNAHSVDPGFDSKGVLIVPVNPALQGYSDGQAKELFRASLERLRSLPDVASATLARTVPLGLASGETRFVIDGRNEDDLEHPPYAGMNVVEAAYFHTLGIPLASGRSFADSDVSGAPGVVVVNETMARRFWPDASPLGQRLRVDDGGAFLEIVGVVRDSKYGRLGEEPQPYIYLPMGQNHVSEAHLIVRASRDPAAAAGALRAELIRLDGNLAPLEIRTMEEQISLSLSAVRAVTRLVGGMGVLALVLAAVGVFGVLAYTVSRRTREIGIRMALGAQPREVLALILRQGMVLVLVGEAIGLALALVLTRFMSGLVFGVSPADPFAYLASALLLTAVAVVAGYAPARRAAGVAPYTALRQQ